MADSDVVIAPIPAASERPPPWRLGGIAAAGGLIVSAVVHLGLVGTALFVSPLFAQPEPAAAVPVDLVTPDELAAASAAKTEQAAQQNASDSQPQSQTPSQLQGQTPSQPQSQTPSQLQGQTPSQPQSQTPPPGSAAVPPPSPPEPSLPLDAFALPRPPAPARVAPVPPSSQAAELAQLIGLPAASVNGGSPSENQAKLTGDEIAAFAAHVRACWTAPSSLANTPTLNVVVRVSLRRDGSLMGEPVLIAAPASTQGPPLVQSAIRALLKCQPYGGLPEAKYEEWRLLDLHFSPGGLSTATPVTNAERAPS